MSLTYAERVEIGAKVLTEYFGDESWKARIRLNELNFRYTDRCIIGQLFGEKFEINLARIASNVKDYDRWNVSFGELYTKPDSNYYEEMESAWINYLTITN